MNVIVGAIVGAGTALGVSIVYYGTKAAYRHVSAILRGDR